MAGQNSRPPWRRARSSSRSSRRTVPSRRYGIEELGLDGGTKAVIQEFDILDDDANIYKQIGPVLLKQDKTEAVMAVNGRLEFIDKEM
jgi:chaperonin cofactor prefoldin